MFLLQLYEVKPREDSVENRLALRKKLRESSLAASLHGKAAVVLVHKGLDIECLQDVCAFMNEGEEGHYKIRLYLVFCNLVGFKVLFSAGTCPELYTESDTETIASQMAPESARVKKTSKTRSLFHKFTERARQNVHVVVCLRSESVCTLPRDFTTQRMWWKK